MDTAETDEYEFFKNIYAYRDLENQTKSKATNPKHVNVCKSSLRYGKFSLINQVNRACEQFKFLFTLLPSIKVSKDYKSWEASDLSFINYWLNSKLKPYDMNTTEKLKSFYDQLREGDSDFDKHGVLRNRLKEIEEVNLEKMAKLYDLYKELNKIYEFLTSGDVEECTNCAQCAQNCINTYKNMLRYCRDQETKYCKALGVFKEYYQNLIHNYDNYMDCESAVRILPTYSDLIGVQWTKGQNEDSKGSANKMILYSLPASVSLFVVLYKFTPLRQWINFKKRTMGRNFNNINDIGPELLHRNSDFDHVNYDNNNYYIKYPSPNIS
ncbi:Plasmodium variant antigen protein Cir/Yir/Bir, putative [Plasmodium vivax]|nr:Plasmodium variant antigen protein Cir/Yir/Bir, putative [Plasmodium vivax]